MENNKSTSFHPQVSRHLPLSSAACNILSGGIISGGTSSDGITGTNYAMPGGYLGRTISREVLKEQMRREMYEEMREKALREEIRRELIMENSLLAQNMILLKPYGMGPRSADHGLFLMPQGRVTIEESGSRSSGIVNDEATEMPFQRDPRFILPKVESLVPQSANERLFLRDPSKSSHGKIGFSKEHTQVPVEGVAASSSVKNQKQNLRCGLCKVHSTSAQAHEDHLRGKKHKAMVTKLRREKTRRELGTRKTSWDLSFN